MTGRRQHPHVTDDLSALAAKYVVHMQAAGRSPETITARWRVLSLVDRAMRGGLEYATTEQLAAWLANPDWSPWTRATYFTHVKGFYRWAASGREPYLAEDPTAELEPPRGTDSVPNPVTDAELAHALDNSDEWWRRVITIAAYGGLRAGEITRLRREQVSVANIRIVQGKGNRTASVPTHPLIWQTVEAAPLGLVLRSPVRGLPMTRGRLSMTARAHFDAIDLPEVHLHRFRHWFGTKLVESGADLRIVQTLMRHRSLATTMGYLMVVDSRRTAAVNLLPTIGRVA